MFFCIASALALRRLALSWLYRRISAIVIVFFMLFFLSLTGDSIADNVGQCKHYLHLISLLFEASKLLAFSDLAFSANAFSGVHPAQYSADTTRTVPFGPLSLTVLPSSLLSSMPMSIQHQLFNASTFLLFFHEAPAPHSQKHRASGAQYGRGVVNKSLPEKISG